MCETRQHDFPIWFRGDWVPIPGRVGLRGPRVSYMQSFNESKAEKRMSRIAMLAKCARESGRRRRLHWSSMLDWRKGLK